mgnify:CR=1 FL=1
MTRRITAVLTAMAATALVLSCTGEQQPEQKPGTEPTTEVKTVFTASAFENETKTALGDKADGKYPVLWAEGDCISVNGVVSEALTAEEAGGKKANFTVKGAVEAPYTAIYPSSARVSENSVKFVSAQTPAEAGFDPAAAIMVASGESTTLEFRQLCAYLRIVVNYPTNCTRRASKAVFKGNASEDVAGDFGFSAGEDGGVTLGEVSGAGAKTLTLTPADAEGGLVNFCMALPPQTFKSGFSLEFSDAKGCFLKAETTAEVALKQGVILNAPELTFTALDNTTSDLDEVEAGQLTIVWDKPVAIDPDGGTYGRVHRLNDGRLMATYTSGNAGQVRFSSNNGNTWTAKTTILPAYTEDELTYRMDNIEFAQLSSSNPYKPGRIIYAVNERGKSSGTGTLKTAYHISVCTSDDNGAHISKLKRIHTSATSVGCYEPFVLELPDGTVQIYFADEMAAGNPPYQKIRVAESKDGGETWGTSRDVCYTAARRDGMPTAMLYGDNIYLAIEHYATDGEQLHPQVVYNQISDNWANTVYASSPYRFDPFETSLASDTIYSGAPYIAQTDNYFLISYQTADVGKWGQEPAKAHRLMDVQICPKSEMTGAKFEGKMRVKTRIPVGDGVKTGINWPSLCPLGGDEFLAIYELHDITDAGGSVSPHVWAVRGRITTSTPEFE